MAKGQTHLTPDGPGPCSVDPSNPNSRGCPFTDGGHYDTESEAEAAYAELMAKRGYGALASSSGVLGPLRDELDELASRGPGEVSVTELQAVGARIESAMLSASGVTVDRKGLTSEDLSSLASAASSTLRELQGKPVKLRSKFYGPFARTLKDALEPVPTGAAYLVSGDVHTETVNARNSSRDGFHIHQAAVMQPAALETKSSIKISENAQRGDLVVERYSLSRQDTEEYTGFAVDRVERGIGEELQPGDSVLHSIRKHRADDKFIELLQSNVLDTDGVIQQGQAEKFQQMAPELVASAREVASTSRLYAGQKPTGAIARGKRYKKIADSFELKDEQGESFTVEKPLYEIQEKSLSFKDHTIGTKRYGGDPNAQRTVLLHEFSHAIQSARRGGIPGERELFQEIYPTGNRVREDGYERYEGFPDDYMGDVGGREVFTRASEGLFYPQYSGNEYLYDGSERSQEVRRWALGTWALLAAEGSKQSAARGR